MRPGLVETKVSWTCRGDPRKGFNWKRRVMPVGSPSLAPEYCFKLPVRDGARRADFRFRPAREEARHLYGVTLGCGGFNDTPFTASKNHQQTCEAAFRKRLSPLMPIAEPDQVLELKEFTRVFCKKHVKPLDYWDEDELLRHFEEWIEGYDDNKVRKEELRELFRSEIKPPKHKMMRCKGFFKSEPYPSAKLPRFICSRSDDYKVQIAAYVHAIEREIFHGVWASWFVKGKDRSEFPAMIKELEGAKYFMLTDYTSYESSFSPELTDAVECELWRHMLRNNPEALDLFLDPYHQLDGRGKTVPRVQTIVNDKFRGKITGTRMSGEMWTSLGNGFTNLIVLLFLLWKKDIYPRCMPDPSNWGVKGLIEGDDGAVGLPSMCLCAADFAKLGFKIEIKWVKSVEEVSFCSVHFDPVTLHSYVEPENIIRFNWTFEPKYLEANKHVKMELLRAKAMSLYVLGKYTPIANRLALKVISLTAGSKARFSGDWWERQKQKSIKHTPFVDIFSTERDREIWATKFGVPVPLQLELEALIDSATCLEELSFVQSICKDCKGSFEFGSNVRGSL